MVTDNYLVIALPIINVGARCGLVVNATPRPLNSQYRDPVPIVQVAG
jgi:hypothetical protein